MNMRPILTLEEDFRVLGVIDEMGTQRKPQPFPPKKKPGFQKPGKPQDDPQEDIDGDSDGVITEKLVKMHKLKGMLKLKARKAAKRYYRKMKQKIKRIRKSAKFKMRQLKLSKLAPARKGFKRFLGRLFSKKSKATEAVGSADLDGLAEIIDSLRYTTNVGQFGTSYQSLASISRQLAGDYQDLSEEYVSTNVDYLDMAEACQGIAAEAMEFATSIQEHDDDVSVDDKHLLADHIQSLAEELNDILNVYEYTRAAITIDEGEDIDDDDDLSGGEDMLEADEVDESDESAYVGGYAHGNDSDTAVFSVMHPLGISRVDHAEKLVLQQQLARETAESDD